MRGNLFFGSGALASVELVMVVPVAAELVVGWVVGPVVVPVLALSAAGVASAIPAVSGEPVAPSAAPPIGTQTRTAKRGRTRMDDPV